MKIAFIGTGIMGRPMALHLATAGYDVTVYNRTLEKAKQCQPMCQVATDLKSAVKDADIIFSIVGMVQDVEDTYLGADGIIAHAPAGAVLCDMTTSSPELAKHIATTAAAKGQTALDAPVTGGDKGAIEATLSIMVGGDKTAFETVLPYLNIMGKTITYMGEAGNGQHAKLANQISIAGTLAGCAEALSYAAEHNLDPDQVLQVINNGSAASWQSQNLGPKMAQSDFEPGFRIRHLTKDLGLGVMGAEKQELPVLNSVLEILKQLSNEGYSENCTQAIIEFYRRSK